MPADEAQALAEAAGRAMYAEDRASQGLGIELLAIAPGFARMRLRVREDMVNGHGIGHGGFTFALADSAFAFACNSRNEVTVALGCQISFVAPVRLGDVLTAEAREAAKAGRTGVYDVTVSNQEGTVVALFRGNSYRTKGQLVPS